MKKILIKLAQVVLFTAFTTIVSISFIAILCSDGNEGLLSILK